MLVQQKEAAFTLAAGTVFGLLPPLLAPVVLKLGSEVILFALMLFILILWLGRRLIGARFKALDEMDKTIRYQAALIAIHGFGAVVIIFACALFLLHRSTLQVPLHRVLWLAYYGWISLYVFWSAAMLVLYRRGALDV